MRLIDADAAIKDANLNYGGVYDAVLMKHFLDRQPTVSFKRKIEWEDILVILKETVSVSDFSFLSGKYMVKGVISGRELLLIVANEFIKSMIEKDEIYTQIERAFFKLTGKTCIINVEIGKVEEKIEDGCEACENKYCITCAYQMVDEFSEPCLSCDNIHRNYKPTNYCCECGKYIGGE